MNNYINKIASKIYNYFDNDMGTHFDEVLGNEIEIYNATYNMIYNAIINKNFTNFETTIQNINNKNLIKKLKKAVCYKMEV